MKNVRKEHTVILEQPNVHPVARDSSVRKERETASTVDRGNMRETTLASLAQLGRIQLEARRRALNVL